MGAGRALPDLDDCGGPAAGVRLAGRVQRAALDRADGGTVALAAARPAALASGLPADAAVAAGWGVREPGARPAGRAAAGAGPERGTFGDHSGRAHLAVESGKRRPCWL